MNIDEVRARYQRALGAKPSKGDYTQAGIDAITDSVCDIPDLLAEVAQLTRWKSEAMAVMGGLEELGRALNLPLGARITATSAAENVANTYDLQPLRCPRCDDPWHPRTICPACGCDKRPK